MKFVVLFVLGILCTLYPVYCAKLVKTQDRPSNRRIILSFLSVGSPNSIPNSTSPPPVPHKPPPARKLVLAKRVLNSFEHIFGSNANFLSIHRIDIKYFLKLFGDIAQARKNSSSLSEKCREVVAAIITAVENYEKLVEALRNFKNGPSYTGSILYCDVMAFTGDKINRETLTFLIECLSAIKLFYQCYFNIFYSSDYKAGYIFKQIQSNFAICVKRRVFIEAFLDMDESTSVDLLPYLHRCDFYDDDLKHIIMEAAKFYPKANRFFTALVAFADENVEYFGKRSNAQALYFSNVVHKMKETFYLPKLLEIIRGKWIQMSSQKQFRFNNVSATKEMIPKGVKNLQINENQKFQFDDFDFEDKLGEGGQAAVFKGNYNKAEHEQPVAIKLLLPSMNAASDFAKEVYYLDLLRDAPFICRLLYWKKLIEEESTDVSAQFYKDEIELTAQYVLVMELAKFGTLSHFLESDFWNELPKIEKSILVRKWMSQIVVAVQHMHARGIIHRDLKMDNILLTESHNIRVIDFGVTKRFKESHQKGRIYPAGTNGYIPPEVYKNQHADYSTDVFALGVIFYHFITNDKNLVGRNLIINAKMVFDQEALKGNGMGFTGLANYTEGYVNFPVRNDAPEGAKELFQGMVHPDPKKRLTIMQIMKNKYFKGINWRSLGALEKPLPIPNINLAYTN